MNLLDVDIWPWRWCPTCKRVRHVHNMSLQGSGCRFCRDRMAAVRRLYREQLERERRS